jgi:hypothetical protein
MSYSKPLHLPDARRCAVILALVVGIGALQTAGAGPLQLPAWPQKFEIAGPESASFGFIVTQPGLVAIDVHANGAPVVATLVGALGRAAEQGGSGALRLSYEVAARDLKTSQLWTIRVRLAEPAAAAASARAGGIVTARYPAVDPAGAQAVLDRLAAQRGGAGQAAAQLSTDPQAAAAMSAKMDASLTERRSQLEQQRLATRGQMYAQLQPLFAAAQARLGGQVATRGLAPQSTAAMTAAPTAEMRAARPPVAPVTAPSSPASGGAGSGPSPPAAMPNVVINSLSAVQGQPGDPVLISGSGFGTGGVVHFIVGPGRDLIAQVDGGWSDTQVFVTVPDVSGVIGFNGQAYLVRSSDQMRSNLVPFHFNPLLEVRDLRSTMNRVLAPPSETNYGGAAYISRRNENPFAGFWGNDVLFNTAQLKNGWLVDDGFVYCEVTYYGNCNGGAYVASLARGSASPSMMVHWWIDAATNGIFMTYTYDVRIVGPKGVADGVSGP